MIDTDLEIKFASKLNDLNNEVHRLELENDKLKNLLTICYEHLATEASVIPLNIVLKQVWEVLYDRH